MSDICLKHIEDSWKEKTTAANKLFNKRELFTSLALYKEALIRAELLNSHLKECLKLHIPFSRVFTISCNNLAHNYEDLGEKEKAAKTFEKSIIYLENLQYSLGNTLFLKLRLQYDLNAAIINYKNFKTRTTNFL